VFMADAGGISDHPDQATPPAHYTPATRPSVATGRHPLAPLRLDRLLPAHAWMAGREFCPARKLQAIVMTYYATG